MRAVFGNNRLQVVKKLGLCHNLFILKDMPVSSRPDLQRAQEDPGEAAGPLLTRNRGGGRLPAARREMLHVVRRLSRRQRGDKVDFYGFTEITQIDVNRSVLANVKSA